MFADLLLNAIASGIVLGGFYAAVSVGLAISFGMLDICNLAHPAFVILGSFCVYVLNQRWGIDPLIGAIAAAMRSAKSTWGRRMRIIHSMI